MTTEKQSVKLTKLSTKGGCAAKWSPGDLKKILSSLSPAGAPTPDKRLLLGYETSDDCAIWQLSDDTVGVFTVDFFTPVVDDPYEFGRVAAANALSDVFAMGAQPHVALNLLALDSTLGTDVAAAILQGGADAVAQAGAFVSGGHTIDDSEPKYGLSVFGTVAADAVVRNAGTQPGDVLYLTKPLGAGIMSAAARIDYISQNDLRPVIDSMMELNAASSKAMVAASVHAATDVTGFGLAGHLHEMLEASACSAIIDFAALPLFKGVWQLSCDYCRPGRTFSTIDYLDGFIDQGTLDDTEFDNRLGVICDPQTSGGILTAIPSENAAMFEKEFKRLAGRAPARIGHITEGNTGHIAFSDGE